MARTRNLKPGFFLNEDLAGLPPHREGIVALPRPQGKAPVELLENIGTREGEAL